MSFGDPKNPYGQEPEGTPGYGYPQQAPQGVPQQGYSYPQQPGQPYGAYPQQPGPIGMPPLAHWGLRFAGTIIDALLFVVPFIVVVAGTAVGGGFGNFLVAIGYIGYIGLAIWQLIKEGKTGQTVGKKVMNIRLLREADGQPLGVGMAFVRRIAHFLDGIACYIGFLWPLWDSKKQTFADKICSSVVIKTN